MKISPKEVDNGAKVWYNGVVKIKMGNPLKCAFCGDTDKLLYCSYSGVGICKTCTILAILFHKDAHYILAEAKTALKKLE